ncbi:MAG: ATP-binding protein [Chloroflexi bacterium]|nr:ATP-binding protein [Chloroflexota bacterium]
MALEGVPLEELAETHLQSLVENKVPEGQAIEYKQSLPGNRDKDKIEFLADISSFANAAGGRLIYGMRAERGIAKGLVGLPAQIDLDAEVLRLENMIRDGIKHRIIGYRIQPVPLAGRGQAIVISVPRSWARPHRVVYGNHGHFYTRSSNGKHQLDVGELRSAFLASETIAERIRAFRMDRVSVIMTGLGAPIRVYDGAKVALHLVPMTAFDPTSLVDVSSLDRDQLLLGPLSPDVSGSRGFNFRYNLDGFLTYFGAWEEGSDTYLQLFRNGAIEWVLSGQWEVNNVKVIPHDMEIALVDVGRRCLRAQKLLGVQPPIVVVVSLLGVAGRKMHKSRDPFWRLEGQPIDRDELLLPDIWIDDFDCDLPAKLKPAFDALWQAAGWPRSLNYDTIRTEAWCRPVRSPALDSLPPRTVECALRGKNDFVVGEAKAVVLDHSRPVGGLLRLPHQLVPPGVCRPDDASHPVGPWALEGLPEQPLARWLVPLGFRLVYQNRRIRLRLPDFWGEQCRLLPPLSADHQGSPMADP